MTIPSSNADGAGFETVRIRGEGLCLLPALRRGVCALGMPVADRLTRNRPFHDRHPVTGDVSYGVPVDFCGQPLFWLCAFVMVGWKEGWCVAGGAVLKAFYCPFGWHTLFYHWSELPVITSALW